MNHRAPDADPSPAPTAFASAGRASAEAVAGAAQELAREGLLCQLLDAIPQWVMVLNEQRQIIYANRALVEFAAGRGCQAFLGQRPGELLACQTVATAGSGCGTGEACRNCGAALAILGALAGTKSTQECRILSGVAGEAAAFDLQVSGTPLPWRGRNWALLVAGDISPLKRRQVLERIFFHDILNTAGGIQGIASLLASGDVTLPEMLEDLNAASESLVTQIESQRMLLAAENQELEVEFRPLRSLEVLEAVNRSLRNHPAAEGREVVLDVDAGDFGFSSDPALLTRVLGNLLKNALEATGRGGRVTLGCREDPPSAIFWVHNPAVMPREVQLQVFQRSFSTKGIGRGIGTYSIRLLTGKYLQGHVTFVSSPATGTVFTVTLPTTPVRRGT